LLQHYILRYYIIMVTGVATQNVTELLRLASEGNAKAQEKVFRAVYAELRQMAKRAMRDERVNHTLEPTALIHEAFLRLAGESVSWNSRAHFFAVAASTMRRVLIDYARSASAQKRGRSNRVDFDLGLLFTIDKAPDLIDLDEAMTKLEARNPRACRVVELQFFAGMTATETAAILGVNAKTVQRDWKLARAWLHAELADVRDKPVQEGQEC
jgi:RNA polymerase sigma-70 factor (ECF subfamily)